MRSTDDLLRVSALYAGVAGRFERARGGLRLAESFGLSLSLSFLVASWLAAWPSLGGVLFGALFIEFVPNPPTSFPSISARRQGAAGAIYGCSYTSWP